MHAIPVSSYHYRLIMEVKSGETEITRDEVTTTYMGRQLRVARSPKNSWLSEIPARQYGSTAVLNQKRAESY